MPSHKEKMEHATVEIRECDENGNTVYVKHFGGFEAWCEYDQHGNPTHFKDSNGFESWYEYDQYGKCIHAKYSSGEEQRWEYGQDRKVARYTILQRAEEI